MTPFPIDTPPCGLVLICQCCGAPLTHIDSKTDNVPAKFIQSVFGYHNRCLVNAACPWCHKIVYAITAPANCRLGGYVGREQENPNALFRMEIDCVHCGKNFWMEWD